MIDFRYHLVSLVSVFLALAVGIVLGAGPLKGELGDTLTTQVQQLRQQKDDLRAERDTAQAALGHRDAFVAEVMPTLISQQLAGRTVVLVRLPGSDGGLVDPLAEALATAGAKVSARVEVKPGWIDPKRATFREQLAGQLAGALPTGSSGASADDQLAMLLARGLVTTEESLTTASDPQGKTVRDALTGGDLIGIDGDLTGRATAVVVLAAGQADAVADGAPTPTASAAAPDRLVAVVRELDGRSSGTVLLGPASSALDGGLVSEVRGDADVAEVVSTVDTAGSPMGLVTAVLALREQLSGGSAQYGFGDGAKAELPPLPGSSK